MSSSFVHECPKQLVSDFLYESVVDEEAAIEAQPEDAKAQNGFYPFQVKRIQQS